MRSKIVAHFEVILAQPCFRRSEGPRVERTMGAVMIRARFLAPLVETRGFGRTPLNSGQTFI